MNFLGHFIFSSMIIIIIVRIIVIIRSAVTMGLTTIWGYGGIKWENQQKQMMNFLGLGKDPNGDPINSQNLLLECLAKLKKILKSC